MHVAGWMTLGLEERIEVPERALDPAICRHFIEAHGKKNFAELSSHLEQRVQVTALRDLASRIDVCLFELCSLPLTCAEHVGCELSLKLCARGLVVGALGHLVRLQSGNVD